MVWALLILTAFVLMFENLLDFRSYRRHKNPGKKKVCLQRLLRRHVFMAAFFAWGATLLNLMPTRTLIIILGVLAFVLVFIVFGFEKRYIQALEKLGWMILLIVALGLSAILFFEVMAPWLLISMTVVAFLSLVVVFDRFHGRLIDRLTRVVPYFHRMDEAEFLNGLAFKEHAYMLDIKALRSLKNAMIVGLFRPRRLYVSKAMLRSMSPQAVESIIAHEVGHVRRGHIIKRLIFAFLTLMVFILAGLLIFNPVYEESIAYSMLFTTWFLLGTIARSVLALFMQQQEYDADRYAFDVGKAGDLVVALRILERQEEEAGDPLRSRLHSTHPPIQKRMERLRAMNQL